MMDPFIDWLNFAAVFLVLILIDLWRSSGKGIPDLRVAIGKTLVCMMAAACFAIFVWLRRGPESGLQFVAGYALEVSLSFDNVFVMSLIMTAMAVPMAQRARMLLYGIAGAILLRGIFIGAGSAIVSEFRWVLIGFAVFLIWTGGKMLLSSGDDDEPDVENSRTLRFLRRFLPITQQFHGGRFFIGRSVTPLFVCLILVELADITFAVDSIPAIFAITTDPFVVFTSNMFAVASLRSLFFVLEAMVERFSRLSTSLAAVLVFIGGKVIYTEVFHGDLSVAVSLGIVLALLGGGICWSLLSTRGQNAENKA